MHCTIGCIMHSRCFSQMWVCGLFMGSGWTCRSNRIRWHHDDIHCGNSVCRGRYCGDCGRIANRYKDDLPLGRHHQKHDDAFRRHPLYDRCFNCHASVVRLSRHEFRILDYLIAKKIELSQIAEIKK